MQIELSESTERILEQQASTHGRSVDDYAASVLSRFALASAASVENFPFEIESHEDALLWVLSRNPTLGSNRPEETDWQALRSEGRRF